MSDIYRLDDLDGMTVGAGQNFDNFAEVIDYLLETRPYGEVKELLGFDSIADLSEYLVDSKGNYDESEAREICMNALGGEDIDEEDPYAENFLEFFVGLGQACLTSLEQLERARRVARQVVDATAVGLHFGYDALQLVDGFAVGHLCYIFFFHNVIL